MKRALLVCSLLLGLVGGSILLRCLYLSVSLGGLEYGDFMQFAWVGYDAGTDRVEFADYPTGGRPWYSFISAWWLGFGCLGLSVASVVAHRNLKKGPANGPTSRLA